MNLPCLQDLFLLSKKQKSYHLSIFFFGPAVHEDFLLGQPEPQHLVNSEGHSHSDKYPNREFYPLPGTHFHHRDAFHHHEDKLARFLYKVYLEKLPSRMSEMA